MKNLKKIVPIILVAVMALSWYNVLNGNISRVREYNSHLEGVKLSVKDDLPAKAIEHLDAALAINPEKPEPIYILAEYFFEKQEYDDCINLCEGYYPTFKKEVKMYELLCKSYAAIAEYTDCIEMLEIAANAGFINKELKEIYKSIRYNYEDVSSEYSYISSPKGSYCVVKKGDKYGIIDSQGNLVVRTEYLSVGGLSQLADGSVRCPVVDKDGKIWFVDENGSSKFNFNATVNTQTKYSRVGSIADGVLAICDSANVYSLINLSDYSVLLTGCTYIGSCKENRIPVQKDGKWFFVDNKGVQISETVYDDIKVDDFGFAFTNGVAAVKQGEKYVFINPDGKVVSQESFENARAFVNDDQMTAVLKGNMWGFANIDGKPVHCKYADTRPFTYGYGSFNENGKWGFVDANGNVIIKGSFDSSNGFVSPNTAIVQTASDWTIIKFYISEILENSL